MPINKTKKEYLNPHTFGNGLKLMEFTSDGRGVLQGLSLLLANGNGRGGGDHPSGDKLIGSWSGDNITIEGDYADNSLWDVIAKDEDKKKPQWKDVSIPTYRLLLQNTWVGREMEERILKSGTQFMMQDEKKLMEELFPKACVEGDLRQKFDFVEKGQSDE